MATVAEKTGTTGGLIDDIATTATALAEWADADTAIVNDQSTDDWFNNARVLEHTPSGMFLLIYIHDAFFDHDNQNDGPNVKGIGIVASNDWDSVNNHPAGLTDVTNRDGAFRNDVGFWANDSFDHVEYTTDNNNFNEAGTAGLWYYEDRSGTRSEQAADPVTYFLSIGPSWFNVAAWNTSDGNNGAAAYYTFEYVDNKFWSDGNDPFAVHCQSSAGGTGKGASEFRISMYGWKYWDQNRGWDPNHPYNATGFDRGEWGIINPDANDDTFFFQRPVIYRTNSQTVPVAYIEDVFSNDIDEGGAHGDVITHAGVDYQVFRQSGAGAANPHSAGLRFE